MKKKLLLIFLMPTLLFAEVGFVEPWGKDKTLIPQSSKTEKKIQPSFMTKAANTFILFRQKVITKVDGPRSKFRPTSSRYMQLAMERYGFLRGYLMGCDRLLRENSDPWVYRTIEIDNVKYKYDPALLNKNTMIYE